MYFHELLQSDHGEIETTFRKESTVWATLLQSDHGEIETGFRTTESPAPHGYNRIMVRLKRRIKHMEVKHETRYNRIMVRLKHCLT